MRKFTAVLCAGLLLCFAAGTLVAADAGLGVLSAQGKITAIDLAKKTFTCANDGGSINFLVSGDTKITMGGAAKTLADLKVGQEVAVTCKPGPEPVTAVTISVTQEAAGAASNPAAGAPAAGTPAAGNPAAGNPAAGAPAAGGRQRPGGGAGAGGGAGNQGEGTRVQSKITAIDAAKKTFSGSNGRDGGVLNFLVTDNTKITLGREGAKTFADLQVGQNVMVMYTPGADPAPALAVIIMPAGGGGAGGTRQRDGGGAGGDGGNRQPPAGGAGAGKEVAGGTRIQGQITAVDADKKTITGASGRGASMTFAVTADTKITDKDGKALTLADVKVGQAMMITYTQAGDQATAVTIMIMPAGAGGGAGGAGGRQRPGGGGGDGGGGAPQGN